MSLMNGLMLTSTQPFVVMTTNDDWPRQLDSFVTFVCVCLDRIVVNV